MKHLPVVACAVLLVAFTARAQWQVGGTVVCTADSLQSQAVACSDGGGGVIIAWLDYRGIYAPPDTILNLHHLDVYAQRLNASGIRQWGPNGVPICALGTAEESSRLGIVEDGAGGAIITWHDYRTGVADLDVYAQRVNPIGVVQWALNGVPLVTANNAQSSPAIATDGAGGAIIAFIDDRLGGSHVFAQRINATGVVQWSNFGIPVCILPYAQGDVQLVSDGVGGAIATWFDYRFGTGTHFDIYAQRMSAAGGVLWSTNGVPVCTMTGEQSDPAIVASGTGAIITWWDARNGYINTDIYAQKLTGAGVAQWGVNGVPVCTAVNYQYAPSVTTDGVGGAIVAWHDFRDTGDADIYAQRISISGVAQWAVDGVGLCEVAGTQASSRVIADGNGGAIVAWGDQRAGNFDVYAQRIHSTGTVQWTNGGAVIDIGAGHQLFTSEQSTLVPDGIGGVIAVYSDLTTGGGDVFAQHLDASGMTTTPVHPTTPALWLALSDNYPNPFARTTWFDVTLKREAAVDVEIFDAAGRKVHAFHAGRIPVGSTRLSFDGRDGRGRSLPSGVYFYRVHAAGESVTNKMVIAR